MGSFEVLSRLPQIWRAEKALLSEARAFRPDVAVLLDYPGFHFRVGPELKRLGIPVIYMIPPKVWVWRRSRLAAMKAWVKTVLCILPFEPRLYHEAGIAAEYIGSPLVEELPMRETCEQARQKLGLDLTQPVLAVLPGSRPSEMRRHWEPFLEAARLFSQRQQSPWQIVVPIASTLEGDGWTERLTLWARERLGPEGRLHVVREHSGWVLRAADLGLIKSGTSTLEAAALECPMVVAYRPGRFTSFAVKHVLRYRGPVGLVNLFRGWKSGDALIAPEVLHEQMTAQRLASELHQLFSNPKRLETMRHDLSALRAEILGSGGDALLPSARAARAVLRVLEESRLASGVSL
jgi:lipid-A-disaccharide synthase